MVGFVVLALIMLAGAVGVVALRQPVHAALALVGTLLALAVTYITLEAHFLADGCARMVDDLLAR